MKKTIDILLQSNLSTGDKTPTRFFCSYFISEQLLGANLLEAFQAMYSHLTEKEQTEINQLIGSAFDKTEKLPYRNARGEISKLAETLSKRYGDRMVEELKKIDSTPRLPKTARIIDPKHTSPQLLGHILTNGDIGESIGKITSPARKLGNLPKRRRPWLFRTIRSLSS